MDTTDAPAPKHIRIMAMASWLAPGACVLVRVALEPLFVSGRLSGPVIAAVCGGVLLAGLVCGLTALISTRRYGPKGVFIPAVAGIALCGFLLLMVGALAFAWLRGARTA